MSTLPEIAGVGGTGGAVVIGLGYLLNFILKRRTQERESESGIVETTNATLEIVRKNQENQARDIEELREENKALRADLREKDDEIDELYKENRELKRRVDSWETTYGKVL